MADANKNTMLKYIIVILVILMVNLFGGYFIARKILDVTYSTDEYDTLGKEGEESEVMADESTEPGTAVPLDAINLNPKDSSGEIFSCDIVLEAREEKTIEELKVRNHQILDKVSSYLALKTVEELSDATRWDQYRKEMVELVNSVLTNGKITNLYIKQKIIQYD